MNPTITARDLPLSLQPGAEVPSHLSCRRDDPFAHFRQEGLLIQEGADALLILEWLPRLQRSEGGRGLA